MGHRGHRQVLGLVVVLALLGGACRDNGDDAGRPTSAAGKESPTTAAAPDWRPVDASLGRPGDAMPGGVQRYSFPRSDLKVSLDGVALQAGFALGSYAAFLPTAEGSLVMGDLVLTEPEVGPVMSKLQEHGLDVTAVHNHLLREQPKVMYVHYAGHNADPAALARGVRAALEASATPLGAPSTSAPQGDLGFDPAELDRILGRTGKTSGGLHKYSIGRAEPVTMGTTPLPPATGVATVINFQPLGAGRAAITGDFALLGPEVAAVTRTLRAKGVDVTAVHSHMTDDNPHLYYMHFFAAAPATELARALRAALDQTNSAKS
ncbi:MAG: DUF1259 domain-containing protein [Actinomycetota bacterium]